MTPDENAPPEPVSPQDCAPPADSYQTIDEPLPMSPEVNYYVEGTFTAERLSRKLLDGDDEIPWPR
jgi:hypothetical protein